MRTNIDIDDAVLNAAMAAGPYKTKKDAVEAGLKAIARQAHYREILRWEGKLAWDGDALDTPPTMPLRTGDDNATPAQAAHEPAPLPAAGASVARKRRHAGR